MKRKKSGQEAPLIRYPQQGTHAVLAATLMAIGLTLSAGCSGDKPFGKVNGNPITQDEYIKALERQQVAVPGGTTTNAERLVIDQLIGNKIILDEASKAGALPTDADITQYYEFRKKLFENQFPGKMFETVMKEQGSAPEEVKNEIKVQLAETNVYAKRLKVTDEDVRKGFESFKGEYLPARVQLRLIVTSPNSPEFNEAKKMLDAKTPFDEVAKKINLPQLKATGGLMPQATDIRQINAKYQNEVQKRSSGDYFGPVDFTIAAGSPAGKAWIKVEKKLPAFTVTYDEARPDVLRQVVQARILQPDNAKVRDEIMKMKLDAKFEPSNPTHMEVWTAVKKQAEDAGVGKIASGETQIPGGAAMGAPSAPPGTGAVAPAPPPTTNK